MDKFKNSTAILESEGGLLKWLKKDIRKAFYNYYLKYDIDLKITFKSFVVEMFENPKVKIM